MLLKKILKISMLLNKQVINLKKYVNTLCVYWPETFFTVALIYFFAMTTTNL